MILLALDTCDARGSCAILRDDEVLHVVAHDSGLDYSSWLLPAVDAALAATLLKMREIEVFAVASGPGSFTGLRVGLTTVKAWSEVYGTQISPVSRLEAIASQSRAAAGYVAAFVDAHREQVFGGLYRREGHGLQLIEQEMAVAPQGFVEFVEQHVHGNAVSWISMDPEKVTSLGVWKEHAKKGQQVLRSEHILAQIIGHIGRQRALDGRLKNALTLDAEYLRRSDAEIFWKSGAKRGA